MPKVAKVCACGRQFATYPSVQSVHCSRSCSSRFSPRKKRTGETVNCDQCGATFYRNPTAIKAGVGRYCSVPCHNAAQTKEPVIKACALKECPAELVLKPSQAARQYCSKAHEALARIKRPEGPLYNGRPMKRDKSGYLMVFEPSHPNTTLHGWQYGHRLIAERVLGRFLLSDEHVDHINRDKRDNRPENLQVLSQVDHAVKSAGEYRSDIEAMRTELAEYRRRYGPLDQEV